MSDRGCSPALQKGALLLSLETSRGSTDLVWSALSDQGFLEPFREGGLPAWMSEFASLAAVPSQN